MLAKKIILPLLLLFTINLSIYADFGLDIGFNYENTAIDENGNSVTNDYPFSLVALPSFSAGKLSFELNTPLFFSIDEDFVTFDYSNYYLPEAQDDLLDSTLEYTKFFLSFINYLQWSNFNEDFAFRIGKITNSTIGDGALLYHYEDENVTTFKTRAGLQIKLDGNMLNLPLGIEYVTTDMFNPDLSGGRVFVRPLFFLNNGFINKLTIGYTVTYNKEYNDSSSDYWLNFAYDLQLPLFKNSKYSLISYYDLISEETLDSSTDTRSRDLSQRYGFYGWYFTDLTYDVHIQNYIETDATTYEDFGTSNWDLVSKTIVPQLERDFVISANTGYYSNNGLSKFTLGSEIEFIDMELDNYDLEIDLISSKAIGPLNGFTASVEKTYYRDSSTNEFTETFYEGLRSFKNLDLDLTANIVFYQVNTIILNYSIEGNESGDIDPSLSFGYKFSLL